MMLQYLIIQLDDTSTSFCHYVNHKHYRNLISLDILKEGILFGMKHNLTIQYLMPDYDLPKEHLKLMMSIDNCKIASSLSVYSNIADVIVLNGWDDNHKAEFDKIYVLRIEKAALFKNYSQIAKILETATRFNIVITDIEKFTDEDFLMYQTILDYFALKIEESYSKGKRPQLNLLTDRMIMNKIKGCSAGDESITLAPNGKFYICPAYYIDETESKGSLQEGLNIKNPQLYKLSHAPLCRTCDAFHCRRCIWLNQKTTLEVNIPSHEQCVTAHIERNVSRKLLMAVRKYETSFIKIPDIKEITYLDPFDARNEQ